MYNIGAQWHAIILKCSTSLDHFLETNKRNQSACEFMDREIEEKNPARFMLSTYVIAYSTRFNGNSGFAMLVAAN